MMLSQTGWDRTPLSVAGQTDEGRRAPWGCAAGAPYRGTASPPPPPDSCCGVCTVCAPCNNRLVGDHQGSVTAQDLHMVKVLVPNAPRWLVRRHLKMVVWGRLKRSARAVRAQCNYLGVRP